MNWYVYAKAVRNLRNVVAINYNRKIGREFVPTRGTHLCIETSSICNLACCFCPYVKEAESEGDDEAAVLPGLRAAGH